MGAWQVGIYDDDVACDTRDRFYDLLRGGCSIRTATDTLLDEMQHEFEDDEDGPVIVFALADAQCEVGRLDPRVVRRALKLIDAGVDPRWQATEYEGARREVLEALREKLRAVKPDFDRHDRE